jgi:hypothetical protein
MNVSLPSTQRARAVREKGTTALFAAVEQGNVPVTSASEFAKQFSPAEQTEQIEQQGSPADAVKAAKETTRGKRDPANKEGITALKAKLVEANRLRKSCVEEIRRLGKRVVDEVTMRNYADRRFQKLTAESNRAIPDIETPEGTSPAEQRAFNFIYRASQAIGYGKDNGFEDVDPNEITISILGAAQDAASVWSDLEAALNKRRSKKRGSGS